MSVPRLLLRPRPALAALVLAAAPLAACSGLGTSGTPTTTEPPLPPKEMCDLGDEVFAKVDEADPTKPDYMERVKAQIKRLAPRAPTEIYEDVRVWNDYVQSTSDRAQLATLPGDLQVSTDRIDAWWRQNCGKPLIGKS
jgi:hypothetical protein